MEDKGQALLEYALVGFMILLCALAIKETLGDRIKDYVYGAGFILSLPSKY